jgi:murein DD-endopeptidase MepM/ murein hydrolase activator NlpD
MGMSGRRTTTVHLEPLEAHAAPELYRGLETKSPFFRTRSRSAALLCVAATLAAGCVIPQWPVESSVSSPFGLRWQGGPDLHRGVDLSAPAGTDVLAMAHGTVRFAGTMSGFGSVVWLDHGREILSVYAHLSAIRVEAGTPVRRGQIIGAVGRSGSASAPHLHFEVWKRGRQVDPVQWLGGFPLRPRS